MENNNLPDLEDLEKKLRAARAGHSSRDDAEKPKVKKSPKAYSIASRVAVELVVAPVMGVFIGRFIDGWLGTKPFGLAIFVFLGAGAGLANAIRVLNSMNIEEDEENDSSEPSETEER